MKDHVLPLAGLVSIAMFLGAAVIMTIHGIKEDALLIILLTGSVEVGKAIVGIKPSPQPGTTQLTSVSVPDAPVVPNGQKATP